MFFLFIVFVIPKFLGKLYIISHYNTYTKTQFKWNELNLSMMRYSHNIIHTLIFIVVCDKSRWCGKNNVVFTPLNFNKVLISLQMQTARTNINRWTTWITRTHAYTTTLLFRFSFFFHINILLFFFFLLWIFKVFKRLFYKGFWRL